MGVARLTEMLPRACCAGACAQLTLTRVLSLSTNARRKPCRLLVALGQRESECLRANDRSKHMRRLRLLWFLCKDGCDHRNERILHHLPQYAEALRDLSTLVRTVPSGLAPQTASAVLTCLRMFAISAGSQGSFRVALCNAAC